MSKKQLGKVEEKLDCKKKYLYEYAMFWECNDGSKCQILEDDVVGLLNEQQEEISYWKHRVSSLLWILGQFDEQKVKKLLEELGE